MTSHGRDRPRRPVHFGPEAMEAHGGTQPGPAEVTEAAHQSAAVLVGAGRSAHDPALTARLVALVDEVGLCDLADLWAARPAHSLPGALWRLYALREWVRRSPLEASAAYAAGRHHAQVAHAVAGAADPPGPQELREFADRILAGVFEGELDVALERAAAFCMIVAAGRAELAGDEDGIDPDAASALTQAAGAMQRTGADLRECAALWRRGQLD